MVSFLFLSVNNSFSLTYEIQQLTDNDYDDSFPQINNNGWVAWERDVPGNGKRILLYDGTDIMDISSTGYTLYSETSLQINDNGHVVWKGKVAGGDYEIFYYNGTSTIQITNNLYEDDDPQINNNGTVIWRAYNHSNPSFYNLMSYDGTSVQQIAGNGYGTVSPPQINDRGEVAYVGYSEGTGSQIFLYDGSSTQQISNNEYRSVGYPQLNNNGNVVWEGYTGDDYSYREIFLYDGSNIINLSNNSLPDNQPHIGDNGVVIWATTDIHSDLYLFKDQQVSQLTDWYGYERNLAVSDNGYFVWTGAHTQSYGASYIYVYDGRNINQVTVDYFQDKNLQVNNNKDVVWQLIGDGGYDSEIAIATVVPEPASSAATIHFGGYVIHKGSLTSGELDVLDIGDTISGTITYDPNSTDTNSSDIVGEYKFDSSNSSLSLTMHDISEGNSEIFNETGFLNEINVTDNWSYPGYPTIDGFNPNGEFSLHAETIEFYLYYQNRDSGLDIFDTDKLPYPLPPYDQFNYTRMKLSSRTAGTSYVDILTTWSQIILPPVRIDGAIPTYYSTLQEAYDNALNGDIIQCKEKVFTEILFIDDADNKYVTFQGGYDDDYSAIVGISSLEGNMFISNGTVIIENLLLQ